MTRAEAVKCLVAHCYGYETFQALRELGVTDVEVVEAERAIYEDRNRDLAERLSPDYRGEEMGQ